MILTKHRVWFWSFAIASLIGVSATNATPYASAISNHMGTVSFFLNENADDVTVLLNDGSITNRLGARAKGVSSFSLNVTTNTATNYQIRVTKSSPAGFVHNSGAVQTFSGITNATGQPISNRVGSLLQISSSANPLLRFNEPRGLAVNRNPASPYFGRIYVANAIPGTTLGEIPRTLGDGIYMLNPDQTDALGQGDVERTAGLDFATGRGSSPYRLTIGQDDNVYIADWSDNTGSLYVTDPNVSAAEGRNVLAGPTGSLFPVTSSRIHGSISAAIVEGGLGMSNLTVYVLDEDYQSDRDTRVATERNSLWRHDIGANPPGALIPPARVFSPSGYAGVSWTNQMMDMDRGVSGQFYISAARVNRAESAGLIVRASDGSAVWDSYSASTALYGTPGDVLGDAYAVAVSPDKRYVAVMRRDSSTWLLPLTNGVPDLTSRLWLGTFESASFGRAVRFDAAGNLYVLSSGAEELRIFSPGGKTLAITTSDVTGLDARFTLLSAPAFTKHPESQTTNIGSSVTFVSDIGGIGATAAYQWQLNGTNISGATDAIYIKTNVQVPDSGVYSIIASNEIGMATATATLSVIVPVSITSPPLADLTVPAGSNVVFSVAASGTDPRYQWVFNNDAIADATNSTFALSNAQPANSGSYSVIVSNAPWNVATSTAQLLVTNTPVIIYLSPESQTVGAGANVTFSVAAWGNAPMSYQWQFGSTNIVGATNSTLPLANVQPDSNAGVYTVTVSNELNVLTAEATLEITNRAPVVEVQPSSATNYLNSPIIFSVSAAGTDPLDYQWFFGGAPISGATNSSYHISQIELTNAGAYSVQVSNSFGQITSEDALLTIANPVFQVPTCMTNGVVITWSSIPSSSYRLQYSPDLSTNSWKDVTNVTATASAISITNVPEAAPQRFYRILSLP